MMTAVKAWNGSAWEDVSSIQGPPGPPGPLADPTPPTGPAGGGLSGTYPNPTVVNAKAGGLLATQRHWGQGAATPAITTGANFCVTGTTPLQIVYTPTVPCWWDVVLNVGYLFNASNVYHYAYVYLTISPSDLDGVGAGYAIATAYGPAGQYYTHRVVRRCFRLAASTAYTCQARCSMSGATWGYYNHAQALWMSGQAWAVPS